MTFRILFSLIFIFVLAAVTLTVVGSQSMIENYEESSHRDFIEQTFASIEAGPLALSRLHAANIAQDHLDRLINQLNLDNKVIHDINISSVGVDGYTYASWKNKDSIEPNCDVLNTKQYQFTDAISKYKVQIVTDKCSYAKKLRSIVRQAKITFYVISFGLFVGLILLFLPVLSSLQKANKIISHGGDISQISFIPVRNIVSEALKVQALEISAKKFELAKQVAHDIRSPLSALEMLYSSLNKDDKKTELLFSASSRIKAIANSLLSIDKNNYNPNSQSLSIAVLESEIKKVIMEVTTVYPNVLVNFNISDSIDREIKCIFDRNWLGRIVSNLLNNSIESIKTKNANVDISLDNKDGFIDIKIRDNGIGMTAELIETVLRSSFSTKASGYGLGILSSRKKVIEWEGKFDISSTVDVGTNVIVSLKIV